VGRDDGRFRGHLRDELEHLDGLLLRYLPAEEEASANASRLPCCSAMIMSDLIFNKVTVQAIYNANYNFAQPPLTPTLSAVAANKKVYLYWDAVAERSYDRFLKKSFDFEGYLLYRSG
jgi:hypothetical protein